MDYTFPVESCIIQALPAEEFAHRELKLVSLCEKKKRRKHKTSQLICSLFKVMRCKYWKRMLLILQEIAQEEFETSQFDILS